MRTKGEPKGTEKSVFFLSLLVYFMAELMVVLEMPVSLLS